MTHSQARALAYEMLDDDTEIIDVFCRSGRWMVRYLDYRGWTCIKVIRED